MIYRKYASVNRPIRPGHNECQKRLKEARALLESREGLFSNLGKVAGELTALGIEDSKEVWPLIKELLTEIQPDDYSGGRPPLRSYEKSIEGRELFAFSWESVRMSKRMYLKFAIKGERFVYVSLHKDRPLRERQK